MTQLPPSQSIDDDYTFRLLGVLTAAGRETAEGWSEIGLLINFDPNTYELRTFSNVVWRGQHYDSWITDALQNELINTALGWLKALYDAGYPLWTSMFLGINSDKYFLWEPSYEADFGPWRVDLEGDNWPAVAAGLRKMGTDAQ